MIEGGNQEAGAGTVEIQSNRKNDIFAAGVLFLQMAFGGRPDFEEASNVIVWNEKDHFKRLVEKATDLFKTYEDGLALIAYLQKNVFTERDEDIVDSQTILRECTAVRKMAEKLIQSEYFKDTMLQRLHAKSELGWASSEEIEFAQALITHHQT